MARMAGGRFSLLKKEEVFKFKANFAVEWAAKLHVHLTRLKEESWKTSDKAKILVMAAQMVQFGGAFLEVRESKTPFALPSKIIWYQDSLLACLTAHKSALASAWIGDRFFEILAQALIGTPL